MPKRRGKQHHKHVLPVIKMHGTVDIEATEKLGFKRVSRKRADHLRLYNGHQIYRETTDGGHVYWYRPTKRFKRHSERGVKPRVYGFVETAAGDAEPVTSK